MILIKQNIIPRTRNSYSNSKRKCSILRYLPVSMLLSFLFDQGNSGNEYPYDIHHGRRDSLMVNGIDDEAGAPNNIKQIIIYCVSRHSFIYVKRIGCDN